MRGLAGGLLVVLCATAMADDTKPVNLLTSAPATVAVSSTVDNAKILPDHLVDGKLSTAWNSRTGQLVGAWIAARVPADAKVTALKLTAGFTHKDKKLGDLFTMNPRIKKVRVWREGTVLVEHTLDVENRGLQTIPLATRGGDLKIEVAEVVPGTKKTWRETCVSELEVWGSIATPAKKPLRPSVRIGSLDAPAAATTAQCSKAVFPEGRGGRIGPARTDEKIRSVTPIGVTPDLTLCQIEHAESDAATSSTVVLGLVQRTPRLTLVAQESATITNEDRPENGDGDRASVDVALFPLTTTETAVLVHVTESKYGPMMDDGKTTSTLYRVSKAGLASVLSFESTWSGGEADSADRCTLRDVTPTGRMPDLVLDCVKSEGRWHSEDPSENGVFEKARKQKFRWQGTTYVER